MSPPPLRKIELVATLSEGERRALEEALARQAVFAPHDDIIRENDRPDHSTVILDGMTCRYKTLSSGERQIMNFGIAGDWVDLHSYFLRSMDHSISAMSHCRVAQVPHATVRSLIEDHPRLGQILWRETLVESAIFREWVVNLGARDAHARLAHLLCELHTRMVAVGLADGSALVLPLTQNDLADATGISSVHVNRVFQQLKAEGLATYGRGCVTVHDWDRLAEAGLFEPTYLHLDGRKAGAMATAAE